MDQTNQEQNEVSTKLNAATEEFQRLKSQNLTANVLAEGQKKIEDLKNQFQHLEEVKKELQKNLENVRKKISQTYDRLKNTWDTIKKMDWYVKRVSVAGNFGASSVSTNSGNIGLQPSLAGSAKLELNGGVIGDIKLGGDFSFGPKQSFVRPEIKLDGLRGVLWNRGDPEADFHDKIGVATGFLGGSYKSTPKSTTQDSKVTMALACTIWGLNYANSKSSGWSHSADFGFGGGAESLVMSKNQQTDVAQAPIACAAFLAGIKYESSDGKRSFEAGVDAVSAARLSSQGTPVKAVFDGTGSAFVKYFLNNKSGYGYYFGAEASYNHEQTTDFKLQSLSVQGLFGGYYDNTHTLEESKAAAAIVPPPEDPGQSNPSSSNATK